MHRHDRRRNNRRGSGAVVRTLTISDQSIADISPGAMVAGDTVDSLPLTIVDSVVAAKYDPAYVDPNDTVSVDVLVVSETTGVDAESPVWPQPDDSVEKDPVAVSDSATLTVAA